MTAIIAPAIWTGLFCAFYFTGHGIIASIAMAFVIPALGAIMMGLAVWIIFILIALWKVARS